MKKARILIFGKDDLQGYLDGITGAGAEAVVGYPAVPEGLYDGLLLCGGGDVHPQWYREQINGSGGIDLALDEAEFAVMDAFVKAGKPVLGICRGHQFINVYFGGSLYQHIPEADLHTGNKAHTITTEPGSILNDLYGERLWVNSTHHQAVKRLGDGLRITATASDGHVEAMEHTVLPVISVQWHPETMCYSHKRQDTADGAGILEYFVHICADK